MLPLKLKVYLNEGERKIQNFNQEQWKEICIIFQKLVRNLKEEIPEISIENFCIDTIPYIVMDINFSEGYKINEEKSEYIAAYLCGDETENPVYFEGEEKPHFAESEIVLEENDRESLLERFNMMVNDLENSNNN